jgi:hypothetical protein
LRVDAFALRCLQEAAQHKTGYTPIEADVVIAELLPQEHRKSFGEPFKRFLEGTRFTAQVKSYTAKPHIIVAGSIMPRDNCGDLHPDKAIDFEAHSCAEANRLLVRFPMQQSFG